MQLLDGQKKGSFTTVLKKNLPKLFTRNPAIYFPLFDKTCVQVFGLLPEFLVNLSEKNLFCSATATTKIVLGIIRLWFNYFRGMFAYTLSGRLSK